MSHPELWLSLPVGTANIRFDPDHSEEERRLPKVIPGNPRPKRLRSSTR